MGLQGSWLHKQARISSLRLLTPTAPVALAAQPWYHTDDIIQHKSLTLQPKAQRPRSEAAVHCRRRDVPVGKLPQPGPASFSAYPGQVLSWTGARLCKEAREAGIRAGCLGLWEPRASQCILGSLVMPAGSERWALAPRLEMSVGRWAAKHSSCRAAWWLSTRVSSLLPQGPPQPGQFQGGASPSRTSPAPRDGDGVGALC